jgi:DNA polymerase/3'-5' exonuclease PolX
MSGDDRIPLHRADMIARDLKAKLEPYCARIEIAGSIRRRKEDVGDIEFVIEPMFAPSFQTALDKHPTAMMDMFEEGLKNVMRSRWLIPHPEDRKMGKRYKKMWSPKYSAQVDLFVVRPPAQWGVIMFLRTGPADFSHRMVTICRSKGWKVFEGHIENLKTGETMGTPEEGDVFEALGMPYITPEGRE